MYSRMVVKYMNKVIHHYNLLFVGCFKLILSIIFKHTDGTYLLCILCIRQPISVCMRGDKSELGNINIQIVYH